MAKKEEIKKLYRFIGGGAAYGLGHSPGELVEFSDDSEIPGDVSIAELIEKGVIKEADENDKAEWDSDNDANAKADAAAAAYKKLLQEKAKERLEQLRKEAGE